MLNTSGTSGENISPVDTLLVEGWFKDTGEQEPEFGKLEPGDIIGVINLLDDGIILYKKLKAEEKMQSSTNSLKREYYIYTHSGFVRCGTPNKEKPIRSD